MRILALAALGVHAISCATYGQEVERVKQQLMGMRALELRECLPVPSEVTPQGETEIAIYRWENEIDDERRRVWDPEPGVLTERELTRERREFFETGERPDHMPYCELRFELRGGRVQALEVDGRDFNGLNADSDCLLQTRRCLPESRGKEP